ncbi:MAG: hypothetical protein Q8O67_25825 [Deltaproteobacteria bacterium]|nr:hypothetical protein [Deltaproteobacteria bacterium]
MTIDLGRLGEAQLQIWTAHAGLIVNSSAQHDGGGWDFLVEWPDRASPAQMPMPLDRRHAPRQAFIQVKTTQGDSGRRQVKLSNWRRMVTTPIAAFFLILEYDGLTLIGSHVIHVGGEEIARVLRRLREEEVEGTSLASLHLKTLDVTWDVGARAVFKNGDEFADALATAIGPDQAAYTAAKLASVADSGYESRSSGPIVRAIVSVSKSTKTADELLLEFMLGIIPHLDVDGVTLHDVRFGLEATRPEVLPGGRLSLAALESAGESTVTLSRNGVEIAVLIADTYVPKGIAPQDIDRFLRYRIAASYVDFLVDLPAPGSAPGAKGLECDVKFHLPDGDEHVALRKLRPARSVRALVLSSHSPSGASVPDARAWTAHTAYRPR